LNCLFIGRGWELVWRLPALAAKEGFTVDLVSSSPLLQYSRFIRHCYLVSPDKSLIPTLKQLDCTAYSFIAVTDDDTLAEISNSDLPTADKLRLLPVCSPENFQHLYSKIGLSKILQAHGVKTPPWCIANSKEEAIQGGQLLGYPLLLKQDASGAGAGIIACNSAADIKRTSSEFFTKPVLVQKRIIGTEVDLSALFQEGELLHFCYAHFLKVIGNQFGPSSLRRYYYVSSLDPSIHEEVARLGKALGAHGFSNITCIEQVDGTRFFIEADMRPNSWLEYSCYVGDGAFKALSCWLKKKETLLPLLREGNNPTESKVIPYFLRLSLFEVLVNRFGVWSYIPRGDNKLLMRIMMSLLMPRKIKKLIPQRYFATARKIKLGMLYAERRMIPNSSTLARKG
jgi:hypothetical protein